MDAQAQPRRQDNIAALVDYFASGAKDACVKVGIELEHTLVRDDGSPVSFDDEHGQEWLLEQLLSEYPERIIDEEGSTVGLIGDHASITLEPAGQFELSAGPFESLAQARQAFEKFEAELESLGAPYGIQPLTPGYHPTCKALDLRLIPKRRYEIMNEYLGAISMFGICMMRGSAATQVSIDYCSVEDCLRKLRLANACVPILSLICDNSPIFEGEERPHQLMRTKIWLECDPARCGTVPGVMEEGFSLEDYAAYILDTPAMVACSDGKLVLSEQTFGEIFANERMSTTDIEHALSVFFTDVRLKKYIEIRPADAMPIGCVIAFAALVKGLFYDEGSLEALERLFSDVRAEDIMSAKAELMANGYDAHVYGRPVSEIADELISIAATGLSAQERDYLEPLATLVSMRTTLADIALSR